MAASRIEQLEIRRLLAVLQPDVTWGDDGYVTRTDDRTFIGATADGVLTYHYTYARGAHPSLNLAANDGTPDTSFHTITRDENFGAAVDARGRIYVLTNDKDQLSLTRYAADGDVDSSFGDDGTVTISLHHDDLSSAPDLRRVGLTADGSVYATIQYQSEFIDTENNDYTATDHHSVYKFSDDGTVDTAFGGGDGVIDFTAEGNTSTFVWTAVTDDGKVIFAQGDLYDSNTLIVRYNPDGTRDKTFATDGSINLFTATQENSFALDAQDRLLIADENFSEVEDSATGEVRRYDADGKLDATFGNAGVYTFPATNDGSDDAGAVFSQADGKIVAQLGRHVVRLTSRGRADTTFDAGGFADVAYGSDLVGQLADGGLLASGTVQGDLTSTQSVTKLAPRTTSAISRSGTIYLNGTDGKDDFSIRDGGSAGDVAFDINGTLSKVFNNVTAVVVDLGAGSDVFTDNKFTAADVPEIVNGGSGNDKITTGGGADTIDAGDGDDTVTSGLGKDEIDLGDGSNIAHADGGGGKITAFNASETTINTIDGNGGAWDVTVYGGRANILLSGDSADIYCSTDGNSIISADTTGPANVTGGRGDDHIITTGGDDLVRPGTGNDTVSTGAGDDTVSGEDDYFDYQPDRADDTYDLGSGKDVAIDGYGNNTIKGGDGDDIIRTGGGNDSIDGGLGRDVLRGGDGNDHLTGGGGRDRIFGGNGDDSLGGGGNYDVLVGGLGADTLEGGAGDDLLIAGTPNATPAGNVTNLLDGGDGAGDRYQIESNGDVLDRVEFSAGVID